MTIDGLVEYFEAGSDDQRMLAAEVRRLRERERVLVETLRGLVSGKSNGDFSVWVDTNSCDDVNERYINRIHAKRTALSAELWAKARAALEAVKE